MDMDERVAHAISRAEIWDEENLKRYGDLWIISARDEAMANARKAIEAMRLPTIAMIKAAGHSLVSEEGIPKFITQHDWSFMIDEALR
jgi:hypothetical protein